MKQGTILVLLFVLSVLFLVITMFYYNRFLFFLHGYDKDLLKSTEVEAFVAYKKIYHSKFILFIVSVVTSVVAFAVTHKYLKRDKGNVVYRVIYIVEGVISFVLFINLLAFFLFPKRLL